MKINPSYIEKIVNYIWIRPIAVARLEIFL